MDRGFTLVELVIVVVLLSVLAATVAPRLSDSGGVDETTVQQQAISLLRRMQIQAMQQTNIPAADAAADSLLCHQLILSSTQLGAPTTNPCALNNITTAISAGSSNNSSLQLELGSSSGITFSLYNTSASTGGAQLSLPYLFKFDSQGRPAFVRGAAFTGLRLEIAGVIRYKVCIEPEGYIHPCD